MVTSLQYFGEFFVDLFEFSVESIGILLPAVLVNLRMALMAIAVGVLIGFMAGWARVSRFAVLRAVARGYVEVIRGTPLLIQTFFVFFAIPAAGIQLPALDRIILAFTINTGAYQAEIFRAGFQSIASGQIEAAMAMGMSRWQAMRHVILPQTLRIIAPPLTNEYIIMFKDATPLAFLVAGVEELLKVARTVGQYSAAVLESFLLAAFIFLMISLALSRFLRFLEMHYAVPGLGIAVRKGE